jgi:hypothetical protein
MKRCGAGSKQLPIILTQSQHIYVIFTLILSLAFQEVSVNSLHRSSVVTRYTVAIIVMTNGGKCKGGVNTDIVSEHD